MKQRRNQFVLRWVLGIFLLAMGSVGPAKEATKVVFVKVSTARIRNAPTLQGEVLRVVPFGTRLEVFEHVDDWYRVQLADGSRGFIYDELVAKKNPAQLWVEEGPAKVYSSPSAYAPVVATLEVGSEVHPVGKRDDWYRVELEGGQKGWVHEDDLDDDPPGALWVRVVAASLHAGPSPMSEVVAQLSAGTKLSRMGKAEDFYHVRCEDGKTGFVYEHAVREDKPEPLFVDVGEAEIKSDPTEYGGVKAVVSSGTELVAFDKVGDFYLVRTPAGVLGWIHKDNVVPMDK